MTGERRGGQRAGAGGVDQAGHLDDGVGGQPGRVEPLATSRIIVVVSPRSTAAMKASATPS